MRALVVGHVEVVTFVRVDAPPAPGAILRGAERWEEPAGGGGMAAVELARLAGRSTLVTALGDDPIGRAVPGALAARGVEVRAAFRPEPQRLAITLLDPSGERTIVVIGPAHAPTAAELTDLGAPDAAYFCKGDAAALREVRRQARVLVATARVLPVLREARVRLDALVHSANDPSERYGRGDLDPEPLLVATTEGAAGGRWRTADGAEGRWAAAPLPGPARDAYGAGDCFAAGLAFALAQGRAAPDALAFAAGRGAAAMARRGAHG